MTETRPTTESAAATYVCRVCGSNAFDQDGRGVCRPCRIGRGEQQEAPAQLLAELGDPVAVFAKLVREVEAGQVLVSLSVTPSETRDAALDSLALARDVLDDALQAVLA